MARQGIVNGPAAGVVCAALIIGVWGVINLLSSHDVEDYKEPEPGMFVCMDAHGATEMIKGVQYIQQDGDMWTINPGGRHYKQNVKEVCVDHVVAYGDFPEPPEQVTR